MRAKLSNAKLNWLFEIEIIKSCGCKPQVAKLRGKSPITPVFIKMSA